MNIFEAIFGRHNQPSGYTDDFNRIFGFLMEWEGTSYEDDPQDPGGATKYGIDQRSHQNVHIRDLTLDQAKAIYWHEWDADACPKMPRPVSEVYFNFCVNAGTRRAAYFLQESLGVSVDGVIGPGTLSVLSSERDLGHVAAEMVQAADHFYIALNKPHFLRGWLRRDMALRKFASNQS